MHGEEKSCTYRVIIMKIPLSKCGKKRTTGQNDFNFELNLLEQRENSIA